MLESVFISIGSNLEDSLSNCKRAVELLAESVLVKSVSSFYETAPWGVTDQPDFVNLAVEIETELTPLRLLAVLKSIESRMGRPEAVSEERWGPRVIDLDIIFFGDFVIDTGDIIIPHPLMSERAFVLVPLMEIAPDVVHPVLKKSVTQLCGFLNLDEEVPGPKILEEA